MQLTEDSKPTQEQLFSLQTAVLVHDVVAPPWFDERRLRSKELVARSLQGGNTGDDVEIEDMVLASTLRANDKRVIWLSTWRDVYTRAIDKHTIMVIDPPVNRKIRTLLPREDYELFEDAASKLHIEQFNAPAVAKLGVMALQEIIGTAEIYTMNDALDELQGL